MKIKPGLSLLISSSRSLCSGSLNVHFSKTENQNNISIMYIAGIDRYCTYIGCVVLRTQTISLFNLSDVVELLIMSTLFLMYT